MSTLQTNSLLVDQIELYREKLKHQNSPTLRRVIQAIEAGYEEVTLARREGWSIGFPEQDPRPYPHPFTTSTAAGILATGTLLFLLYKIWHTGFFFFITGEAQYVLGSILLSFAIVLSFIGGMLVCGWLFWGLNIMNERALSRNGLPVFGIQRFLKQPLPLFVAWKVDQARDSGLFDTIQILAPDKAFKRVFLGDPVIFGKIEEHSFLIAQFDLGEDRKHI